MCKTRTMKYFHGIILSLSWHLLPTCATVYEHYTQLPESAKYDFIVVGGGAAGNVIANRLTEDPNVSVLLLEAGGSNEGALPIEVPFFCTRLSNTLYDWNYTTTPQSGLGGRAIGFPRGHVLGGSTSINGLFYTRGSSEDYDRYAEITGDSGWSWKQVQKYIRKNEVFVPPADHHDITGQYDPAIHSVLGVNSVSMQGYQQATNERIIQTTRELHEFHYNLDMNSGRPLGLGWLQSTIRGGKRSSSATSYLGAAYIKRTNLHVLVNARVTRVLPISVKASSMRTVEFVQDLEGPRQRVSAQKEVVLSTGTVGTPHILLNSGIGDADELKALGIKLVRHLPDVGKNLVDHPRLASNWLVDAKGTTFDMINQNATVTEERLREWSDTQQGPLVDTFASHLFFSRLASNSTILKQITDPAAGPNTAHYELGFSNGFVGAVPSVGEYFGITTRVVSPTSRGSITLRTNNPLDAPIIDPGFLSTDFDIISMREAVKSATRFLSAPAWKGYVLAPFGALANATTDDLLDQYIRNQTGTSAHPVGTAAMSAKNATSGVVDPDLRVKGLSGLRIVDASILPFVPSGHTQAPVYIIAERAADIIKDDWRLSGV